jgi:hypothetical protein
LKQPPKDIASDSATRYQTKSQNNTSAVSPPILTETIEVEGTFEVSRHPSGEREAEAFRREKLLNDSDEQDMGERIRYANYAYGITQAWIGFLIVLTIMQFSLRPLGLGLSEAAFITVFTTTTASVFGFWLLVGNYLFKPKGRE